ncbi:MAG: AMP-binding protein [Rhodoblastus sp.]
MARDSVVESEELRAILHVDPHRRRHYEEQRLWSNDTLTLWLEANASRAGDALAAISGDREVSYQELLKSSESFAGGLRSLGVRSGDVVSIQLANSIEFLIAYFGIARLGAVVSTVHLPYRTSEIRTLLHHAESVAFIAVSDQKGFCPVTEALALKAELPALKHVISLGRSVAGATDLTALLARSQSQALFDRPVASDPFLLLFTSGTSAGPKAVPSSYERTLGNARLGALEHRLEASDTILSVAGYTHLLGLYSLHLATAVGATNVLFPAYSPGELSQAISRHRPTVLVCAPAHLAGLIANGLLGKTDFSSVRLVITAGSALPPEVAKAVSAILKNGFLTNLWGMTELQAGLYTRPGDAYDVATSTSGRAAPGAEVRIASADDKASGCGEEGELQIRGSLLFPGYYKNPAATKAAFTDDGWFITGDLAVMDGAGNVRITGRKTEVINRGGMKYNPLDVENLLGSHPKIAEVAIVPYPDPVLGQRACCFVVPKGRILPTLPELCAYLTERGISKVKLPERLEFIEQMPVTPTRKVMKGRLKELLGR